MNKPFYRIIRPIHSDHFGQDHLLDSRYCGETISLIHSYHIIQKDFKQVFDFIELHDKNKETFSHRLYELLLRVCTEFENNCKGILIANGYVYSSNLNATDYFKINSASKLNEYEVKLSIWNPTELIFKPFENWNGSTYLPLNWYQAYNNVKHNRSTEFEKASLDNVTKAIGGLFVILASQFGRLVFNPYQPTMMTFGSDGFHTVQDSIFSIKFPQWDASENIYQWDSIKNSSDPFQEFNFNV